MTEQPAIDRIPIGISVNFAVHNAPNIPNKYGSGSLTPTEITLTYRSTKDSQLGRVHAYVKGRWRRDAVLEATDMPLPGQHYTGDMATWPAWLAEEARLHDPAAVPVPPTTRAADRAAVLREAADAVAAFTGNQLDANAKMLRRMAIEAQQQPDTETPTEHLITCFTVAGGAADPDCSCAPKARHYEVPDETRPLCACGRFWPCHLADEGSTVEQPAPGPGRVADEGQQ